MITIVLSGFYESPSNLDELAASDPKIADEIAAVFDAAVVRIREDAAR